MRSSQTRGRLISAYIIWNGLSIFECVQGGASILPFADCNQCVDDVRGEACRKIEGCSRCEFCFPSQRPVPIVSGNDGRLHLSSAEGPPLTLKGVTWAGSESELTVPEGLVQRSMDEIFSFIADTAGFNAVRILFNHKDVLDNPVVDSNHFDVQKNPDLLGLRYRDMLTLVAQTAAEKKLLVVICAHRTARGTWPGDGLWHDKFVTESNVLTSWRLLAESLCGEWNVIAADLQHEPFAATWGEGYPERSPTDWNKAAERIGDFVLGECARWLVLVEGVGNTNNGGFETTDGENPTLQMSTRSSFWWGENLAGVRAAPVELKDMSKLVYSPHILGPGAFMQPYFKVPVCPAYEGGLDSVGSLRTAKPTAATDTDSATDCFPDNMPALWDEHFGYVSRVTGRVVVVGQFGGAYKTKLEKLWLESVVDYVAQRHFSAFYYSLNPSAQGMAGLLSADWHTFEEGKLQLLRRLPATKLTPALLALGDAPKVFDPLIDAKTDNAQTGSHTDKHTELTSGAAQSSFGAASQQSHAPFAGTDAARGASLQASADTSALFSHADGAEQAASTRGVGWGGVAIAISSNHSETARADSAAAPSASIDYSVLDAAGQAKSDDDGAWSAVGSRRNGDLLTTGETDSATVQAAVRTGEQQNVRRFGFIALGLALGAAAVYFGMPHVSEYIRKSRGQGMTLVSSDADAPPTPSLRRQSPGLDARKGYAKQGKKRGKGPLRSRVDGADLVTLLEDDGNLDDLESDLESDLTERRYGSGRSNASSARSGKSKQSASAAGFNCAAGVARAQAARPGGAELPRASEGLDGVQLGRQEIETRQDNGGRLDRGIATGAEEQPHAQGATSTSVSCDTSHLTSHVGSLAAPSQLAVPAVPVPAHALPSKPVPVNVKSAAGAHRRLELSREEVQSAGSLKAALGWHGVSSVTLVQCMCDNELCELDETREAAEKLARASVVYVTTRDDSAAATQRDLADSRMHVAPKQPSRPPSRVGVQPSAACIGSSQARDPQSRAPAKQSAAGSVIGSDLGIEVAEEEEYDYGSDGYEGGSSCRGKSGGSVAGRSVASSIQRAPDTKATAQQPRDEADDRVDDAEVGSNHDDDDDDRTVVTTCTCMTSMTSTPLHKENDPPKRKRLQPRPRLNPQSVKMLGDMIEEDDEDTLAMRKTQQESESNSRLAHGRVMYAPGGAHTSNEPLLEKLARARLAAASTDRR